LCVDCLSLSGSCWYADAPLYSVGLSFVRRGKATCRRWNCLHSNTLPTRQRLQQLTD
jgi:hypothetical protein